jgi:beta-glucanase (GH16 family)
MVGSAKGQGRIARFRDFKTPLEFASMIAPELEKAQIVMKHQNRIPTMVQASLITEGKASFLYGRIEVRAKLPQGRGVWPAIWMMGTNRTTVGWPRCGEVDIMEFVGKEPDKVHATVHFWKDGKHASKGSSLPASAPFLEFHIYAVEWNSDKMVFLFDQQAYFTFDLDAAGSGPDNPFRKPHYLLLNLALGGSWGGPMDDSMLPQQFQIDFVRVSEPKHL